MLQLWRNMQLFSLFLVDVKSCEVKTHRTAWELCRDINMSSEFNAHIGRLSRRSYMTKMSICCRAPPSAEAVICWSLTPFDISHQNGWCEDYFHPERSKMLDTNCTDGLQ